MPVFAEVVSRATKGGLGFLVIGGNAVIAYGYPRQTQDFDFLVETRHRYAWDRVFRELGYFPKHYHAVFHMYKSDLPDHPAMDLMLVDQATFANFERDAVNATVGSVSVRIPSLLHLVALKLHAERAGHAHRLGRDFNDILMLLKLNHVPLADPALQEILQRFGNEDIRRRLDLAFATG